ncbi:MAG TPA: CPBP family glutamic-type intramembrane protease [Anaerolineales bacterium]|nr:CPBP family intramembrane metalloprotease [Anaerolineales bacterium]HNQ93537.1 CPBP family glutamic-type intramembrane protease [Anaerolineales bacterium]HNS60941.1 CPBP family glutamic-type intramembrane protease [Anaerolineales bacterium]
MKNKYATFFLLLAAIITIFLARAWLASVIAVPRTFEIFDILTVAGALLVLLKGYRDLQRTDWITALILGAIVGTETMFATLFSSYPFLGFVRDSTGQAWVLGTFTFLVTLGGLALMRQGGPVRFHISDGNWKGAGRGVMIGLAVGLPLAVLNIFALQSTQGRSIDWQNPLAALLDALQPGIFEEVIYRFTLWGLLLLALRNDLPTHAVSAAGLLATLIHGYAHFDDLFLQSPLMGLGMGAALIALWGVPPLLLARRRGLESAIAFHWIQDAARFLTGF